MSTKTTFKRVALVAVAAMGFGLLTAIPSNAAVTTDSYTTAAGAATASSTGTVGTASTLATVWSGIAGVSGDTATLSASVTSSPITSTPGAITETNTVGATQVQVASFTSGVITSSATGRFTEYATASFTPDVAGTYVIKLASAGGANNAYIAWTITVGSAATADSTSTIYTIAGVGTPVAVTTPAVTKAITGSQGATVLVTPLAGGVAVTSPATLTATVSGPGTVSISGAGGAPSVGRAVTGAPGAYYINVWADGTAGASTITVSAGSVVLGTATVNFYGAVASYTATVSKSTINANGGSVAAVVAVVAKDALGVVVPSQPLVVTSSNTAVVASTTATSSDATQAAAGTASVAVLPIAGKYGTVTLTFSDGNTTPIAATATASITVSSATPKTVSLAFDKASYAPGEKMVLSLSAVDANGLPVSDVAASALLTASTYLASNVGLQGFPVTADYAGTTTNGAKTFTVYAPLIAGDITVTGTDVNSVALSATASVSGGDAAAAVDAANAATDAANYAADAADAATTAAQEATAAAQAAQDSADAATAAVVALGLRVNVLMASVRAQLTSLSNLLVRIIKKTHA